MSVATAVRFSSRRFISTIGRGLCAAAFCALLYEEADRLEASLQPIITNQSITNVERADNELCWDWRYLKKRDAFLAGMAVQLYSNSPRSPEPVFLKIDPARDEQKLLTTDYVPSNSYVQTHYCVDIPSNAQHSTWLMVVVILRYTTHAWWTVEQDSPGAEWFDPLLHHR